MRINRIGRFFPNDYRTNSLAVLSLLGAWIVTVPYEGQILYTLAENFHIDSFELLIASLLMQAVGLLAGGIFLRTMKASKWVLMIAIPFCMLCTGLFCVRAYWIWVVSLMACAMAAGACIAACGHFFRHSTSQERRFNTAVDLIIIISFLKLAVNLVTLYMSLYTGIALSVVILGAAWYFSSRLPSEQSITTVFTANHRKKVVQAMIMMCLFVSVTAIDFGIMIQSIKPQYKNIEWLSCWYWLLPYIVAALIMKRIPSSVDRGNFLYAANGMIGLAFILFLIFDKNIVSYLVVFTLMMGAWAVFDAFWWGMLGEMLDVQKNAAMILGFGFCANVLGVLHGKIIGSTRAALLNTDTSLIPLAVVCVTLVILPILHRSLSTLLAGRAARPCAPREDAKKNININLPADADVLTEREKQIAALLLKGRTCKLIAAELYLSENTVKTHIKNIYAKLGIRKKSELFNKIMDQTQSEYQF